MATHTADDFPNYIFKASIRLPLNGNKKNKDSVDNGNVGDLAHAAFPTEGISGKLTMEQQIMHDGDVNK